MIRLPLSVAASLVAVATSLSSQQPEPVATTSAATLSMLRTPIHSQPPDEGVPYGTWAAGAGYKASFHDGMTFVPFAAKGAPLQPLAWRTTSVRVGEQELVTRAPSLQSSAWRAEYDLGGVVEAYDVRLAGLEQTFVFNQRPASTGDLVIRGAIDSVLQAQTAADHGAVSFTDSSGRAVVEYGAAVAIDAHGRRAAMTTHTTAEGLELRLPASWLATAAFPLVVDPLLAPVDVSGGVSITEVAVAHDPLGNSNVWYAIVRAIGTDTDLWLYRTDEDGSNPVLVFTDLSLNWTTSDPSLGVSRQAAATVLAITRTFLNDTKRVRLHRHDRADLALATAVVNVPSLANENHWRPVVGSDRSSSAAIPLLVVWQTESTGAFANVATSRIEAIEVDVAGPTTLGVPFTIAGSAVTDCERPSIAEVAVGAGRTWSIAYQRAQNSLLLGTWDTVLRRTDGATVSGEFVIDSLNDRHEFAPRLAGRDGRLMLFHMASTTAQALVRPTGDAAHSIRGVRLEWDGSTFVAPHGARVLQANNDARLQPGGAAYDSNSDSHWAFTFRSNVTEAIYLRTYGYTGGELVAETVETPSVALGTAVVGGVAFQSNDDEFLLAYAMNNPPASTPARLRRLNYPPVFAPSNSGSSCTTTQLGWFGTQWVGSEFCGVAFQNAPVNSFTVVLAATNFASLQLFGVGGVHDGCWLLVPLAGPDYLGMLGPIVGTNGYWQLPLPELLGSQVLRFQAVTFDPATSEFYSSSRLNVPIGK